MWNENIRSFRRRRALEIAPQWLLDAVLPTPRLQYELTRDVSLYAGATVKGCHFPCGRWLLRFAAGDVADGALDRNLRWSARHSRRFL